MNKIPKYIFIIFTIAFIVFLFFIFKKSRTEYKEKVFENFQKAKSIFEENLANGTPQRALREISHKIKNIAFLWVYDSNGETLFEARNQFMFPNKESLTPYKMWIKGLLKTGYKSSNLKTKEGTWIFISPIDKGILIIGMEYNWLPYFIDKYLEFLLYSIIVYIIGSIIIITLLPKLFVVAPIEDNSKLVRKAYGYKDIKEFSKDIKRKVEIETSKITGEEATQQTSQTMQEKPKRASIGSLAKSYEAIKEVLNELSQKFSPVEIVYYKEEKDKFIPTIKRKGKGLFILLEDTNKHKVLKKSTFKNDTVYKVNIKKGAIYMFPLFGNLIKIPYGLLSIRFNKNMEKEEILTIWNFIKNKRYEIEKAFIYEKLLEG